MAEQMMLVCDVCGQPAVDTADLTVGGRKFKKDLCDQHLKELLDGAQAPRRGRPRKAATVAAPRRRGRPPGSGKKSGKKTTRKKTARKKVAAKKTGARRGRPRKNVEQVRVDQ